MKAISLWQPWASAMALGLKSIETRHWPTRVRGTVAIHAAKRWTRDEREEAEDFARLFNAPSLLDPPLGSIIAIGNLVTCWRVEEWRGVVSDQERAFGNYADGRYGWRFEAIQALAEPIPYRGAQGFFDVPDELIMQALSAR
jgi:hypothetical protein